ncbi:MAG: hypothetical protein IPM98_19260 [Lewinellaceae bacterium]|nr:hypothetical protein [Lewinellaceae bacterium]
MPESARDYPPLWGPHSYAESAGLFRLSRFAGYVKANMPLGATWDNPQLTDEEAWDVAAFVNAQPRPKHRFLNTDFPDPAGKPFDHPFGPTPIPFPKPSTKLMIISADHSGGRADKLWKPAAPPGGTPCPPARRFSAGPVRKKQNDEKQKERGACAAISSKPKPCSASAPPSLAVHRRRRGKTAWATTEADTAAEDTPPAPQSGTITLLQTTDVHCQITRTTRCFGKTTAWCSEKRPVMHSFATLFDKVRKQNPNTFIADTGDMFQGSELSVKTTGKAFVPILNALGYDPYLPGNWEVIYYKQAMQNCSAG